MLHSVLNILSHSTMHTIGCTVQHFMICSIRKLNNKPGMAYNDVSF